MAGLKHLMYRITGKIKRNSFPVIVRIIAEREGSKKIYYDRARRVKEGGSNKYVLLHDGGDFDAPAYQHLILDKKGQECLDVYSPRPKVFIPVKYDSTGTFVPTKETDRDIVYQDLVRAAEVTANYNKLISMLMQIAPFLLLGVVLLISIFVLQEVQSAIEVAGHVGGSIAGMTEAIRDALTNMTYACGRGVPAPP